MRKWLSIPKHVLIAGGIILALMLGGIAYASIPGPDGVIHGCYKSNNPAQGSVLVVDSAASCPSGFTALNWNQTGPQRPAGPAGVSGYEVVGEQSGQFTGTDQASLFVDCPSGKLPLSGGFRESGPGLMEITISEPRPEFPAWHLVAKGVIDSPNSSWNFTGYVVCANAS